MTRKPGMQVLFLMVSLFIISITSQAQDILKLKSGKEIKVSIEEENSSVIRYREFENPAGPLYTIEKGKVESVKYGKKQKEDKKEQAATTRKETQTEAPESDLLTVKKRFVYQNGRALGTRQVKTIMEDVPEASDLYIAGRKKCNMSNSCAYAVTAVSFVSSMISNKKEDDVRIKIAATGLAIDAGLIITAIVLSTKGKKEIRRSAEIYNASIGKPVSYRLDFGISPSGAGIVLRF